MAATLPESKPRWRGAFDVEALKERFLREERARISRTNARGDTCASCTSPRSTLLRPHEVVVRVLCVVGGFHDAQSGAAFFRRHNFGCDLHSVAIVETLIVPFFSYGARDDNLNDDSFPFFSLLHSWLFERRSKQRSQERSKKRIAHALEGSTVPSVVWRGGAEKNQHHNLVMIKRLARRLGSRISSLIGGRAPPPTWPSNPCSASPRPVASCGDP